jgi:hypothetical protein
VRNKKPGQFDFVLKKSPPIVRRAQKTREMGK